MNKNSVTVNTITFIIICILIAFVARSLMSGGNYKEAQTYFDRGTQLDDDFRYQEAESQFTAAIELRPRFAAAYAWRCDVRYVLAKFEEALEDCNRALELDASITWVYGKRCLVYSELGNFERAEQDCTRALIHESNDVVMHNRLGLLHMAMGDDVKSIQDYTNALEVDDTAGVVYYNRGQAYLRLGNDDAAIDDFRNAIQFAENHYDSHLYLVSTLNNLGYLDEALAATDIMVSNFPDEVEAYVWRASINRQLENYDAAFVDLFYAREAKPEYPFTYSNLGSIYSNLNKPLDGVIAYCEYMSLVDDVEDSIIDWVEDNGGCST